MYIHTYIYTHNKGPADAAADRATPERHADDLRDVPGRAHDIRYHTLL